LNGAGDHRVAKIDLAPTFADSSVTAFAFSYDSLSRLHSFLHQFGGNAIDGATYTMDNVEGGPPVHYFIWAEATKCCQR
jgi:hypothetical protein